MANPIEAWKSEMHPFDAWPDIQKHASDRTPMKKIDAPDLERMKWHGVFYRKRDTPGLYMNRIRVTAGELSAVQAREIAMMAYQFGHGIVDITTRANLQVQGMEIQHVPTFISRLEAVGLSSKQTGHDNIRNVFAHPFSGLVADELIDTRQLCHDVTELFVNSRVYSDLPRKMNICLNGMESHSAHFWTQDISFLATKVDGEVAFQVLLAGTQGQNPLLARHLPVLVRPDQVVEVTRSLLDLFRAKGSREKRNKARMRFLVEEIGIGGVLEWLEGDLPFPLQPCITEPTPAATHDELVGWFPQRESGLWTMGLAVPVGRMTWQQFEGVAILSRKWGDGQLRTTHEQGLAVINIPTGFRNAAATDAAALGLSVQADPLDVNTMACTGSQFCNIAVTETKGHMLQLIENLRKRTLKLHGIRIHMSGCPSSCAQHFTADIGLKGVRVRRLIGTREGFDVLLGGGLAGQVHLGLPFKLGVDVDQLPTLIENVVTEFYSNHRAGQTFSAYWREKLSNAEATKVGDADYMPPEWLCEACDYRHKGEDPPVFCPSCAGLRRNFARLDPEGATEVGNDEEQVLVREDGFVFAANESDLPSDSGLTVEVDGNEYALFRIEGKVTCIDSACPHEGAPLADGEVKDGVVVCPWHSWEFDACTGCSLEPKGHDVRTYETLVQDGRIFVRPALAVAADSKTSAPASALKQIRTSGAAPAKTKAIRPVEAELTVLKIIQETPDVRTYRMDNSESQIPFDLPGKFLKVCVPDAVAGDTWRSFTVSSSPHVKNSLDLTIKLNPFGTVSRFLFDRVAVGQRLRVKGAQGGFFFDHDRHTEPLVLVSAGSGITPMMSIVRYLQGMNMPRPVKFFYGARTEADIVFSDECQTLNDEADWFQYQLSLSQPGETWTGHRGRIDTGHILSVVDAPAACRFFLCGPTDFMDTIRNGLQGVGVNETQIHTEEFHQKTSALVKA